MRTKEAQGKLQASRWQDRTSDAWARSNRLAFRGIDVEEWLKMRENRHVHHCIRSEPISE